jgi:hypothetical protein
MNEEDKKRFARYMKGYIPTEEDNELLNIDIHNSEKKKKEQLGYVEEIKINKDEIINNVLTSNSNISVISASSTNTNTNIKTESKTIKTKCKNNM